MTRLAPWPLPDEQGVDLFGDVVWQMSLGERAALVGILRTLRPALAIEIGSMEGGSLVAAAAYADEVHSFDLDEPTLGDARATNVHLHTGDSHRLLAPALAAFTAEGRNVDYALVDGDHSSEGVRRDIEDLLASPAVSKTVIVLHDVANGLVRAGCDAVPYDAYPKVCRVELDLVPGSLGRDDFPGELWGGLGLIIVDESRSADDRPPVVSTSRHHGHDVLAIAQQALLGGATPLGVGDTATGTNSLIDAHRETTDALRRELADRDEQISGLQSQVQHHRGLWQDLMRSPSWRVTAPLRAAKRGLGRRPR